MILRCPLLATIPTILLGCAAPQETPTMPNASSQPATPPSDTKPEAFTISFRSQGGQSVGATGLSTWESSFTASGPSGQAVVEVRRHFGDLQGQPIGRFSCVLPRATADALLSAAKSIDFASIPPSKDGGLASNIISIEFDYQGAIKSRKFNGRDASNVVPFSRLLDAITDTMARVRETPERTVLASVSAPAASGDSCKLTFKITNTGIKPVVVTNPQTLGVADPGRFAAVMISDVEHPAAGYSARGPIWERLALEPAASGAPARIKLGAGESFECSSVEWKRPRKDKGYIAQAVFSDYQGAPPDTDATKKPDADAYLIKGCAFSKVVEFIKVDEPKK